MGIVISSHRLLQPALGKLDSLRGKELPSISIIDHVLVMFLAQIKLVAGAASTCDDVIVLSCAGIAQGFFVPFYLTIHAMLSRLVIFFRNIFASLRKAYTTLLKIAHVPILSIREV